MTEKSINPLASDVAGFLESGLNGDDFPVSGFSSLANSKPDSVVFVKNSKLLHQKHRLLCLIYDKDASLFRETGHSFIAVENPRIAFGRVLTRFFIEQEAPGTDPAAVVHSSAEIGKNVAIGANTVIGAGVRIGDDTVVRNSVVIDKNVVIGKNCLIKSNTVIGEEDFGFEYEGGVPVKIPQTGSVVIHNDVEVGPGCVIGRGTIDNTVIHEHVKIDAQVHIAHNCIIGENTIITVGTCLGGSIVVGRNCWLAPNCSLHQKIKVGDYSTIGIGAVVLKDVPRNTTIMGLDSVEKWDLMKYKMKSKYPSL